MTREKLNKAADYPLQQKRPELIKAASGRPITELTFEDIIEGKYDINDGRISRETLICQAEIAESNGSRQIGFNLRRAAELTEVPDELILHAYHLIRPFKATKEEILETADEFEHKYNAKINADFLREAADILEGMKHLKNDKVD